MPCRRSALVSFYVSVIMLVCAPGTAPAGHLHPDPGLELRSPCLLGRIDGRGRILRKEVPRDRTDRPIDVLHYDLRLDAVDTVQTLSGEVDIRLRPLKPADHIVLDFDSDGMAVSAVEVDGVATTYTHAGDTLRVELGGLHSVTDTTLVRVHFGGTPLRGESVGFGYAVRYFRKPDYTTDFSRRVVATLSEPVSARNWWPCHDQPYDAASFVLSGTVLPGFTLAAPGQRIADTTLTDGRRWMAYSMPTPVPSYLVSLVAAELVQWQEVTTVRQWQPGGGETPVSMPLVYYAPPTLEGEARNTWQNTAEILSVYEDLFGPYPYADLQYGMALFSFGGAMEHPTLSSMGDITVAADSSDFYPGPFGETIVAHEAFHQWFGDALRVARWGDIWLNEGFARYGEVLWLEKKYGPDVAKSWLEEIWREDYPGPLRDPVSLFGSTVYNKGAWVVHMLRQVLRGYGDAQDQGDGLMSVLRAYATDPELRHARAVTVEDLRAHAEAVYGEDLGWFFDPWLQRAGRAEVDLGWIVAGGELIASFEQPSDKVYRLPLPVRLVYGDGTREDVTVWVGADGDGEDEWRRSLSGDLVDVQVDPDHDWLVTVGNTPLGATTRAVEFLDARPNPFNPRTRIRFLVREPGRIRLDVYDARGRRVKGLLDAELSAGLHTTDWDGSGDDASVVGSGVYYLRIEGGGVVDTGRVTLVR